MDAQSKPSSPEESCSTAELLAEARLLAVDIDDPRYWNLICALQKRAPREIWERAAALCESEIPSDRGFGANLLSRLGNVDGKRVHPKFWRRSVPLLLHRLEAESDPEVLESVVAALGCLHDPRVIAPLVRFKDHSDEDVRWNLVMALGSCDEPLAIGTLIEMTRDESAKVRDWATFQLGTQTNVDTPELREALAARLNDDDAETRAEAIRGLAERQDPRALEALIREITVHKLSEVQDSTTLLRVAKELNEPRVGDAVLSIKREDLPSQWREYYDETVEKWRTR